MINVNYINYNVNDGDILQLDQVQTVPQVSWDFLPGHLYTLILYDMDAPEQVPDNINAPFVLWLVVNIPNNQINNGDTLLDYIIPIVNKTDHYLVLAIYHQMDEIADHKQFRSNFALQPFVKYNNLQKLGSIEFYVTNIKNGNYIQNYSSTGTNGYTGVIALNPYQQVDVTRRNYFDNSKDKLTTNQQEYCQCIAGVQSSADWSCQEQIWGKANCANPKNECRDLLNGNDQPTCNQHVDFLAMPDEDLIAYAQLEDVEIPYPYDRTRLIANLIDDVRT